LTLIGTVLVSISSAQTGVGKWFVDFLTK